MMKSREEQSWTTTNFKDFFLLLRILGRDGGGAVDVTIDVFCRYSIGRDDGDVVTPELIFSVCKETVSAHLTHATLFVRSAQLGLITSPDMITSRSRFSQSQISIMTTTGMMHTKESKKIQTIGSNG